MNKKTLPGLFLSYNSADRQTIARIAKLLEDRGLDTFLDYRDLAVGLPWPEALEQALTKTGAVAVFLGGEGLGTWQKREMWFALDRQVQAEKSGKQFPVIPVILPGGDPAVGFLSLTMWVDLRKDPADPSGLDRIVRSLTNDVSPAGIAPSPVCPYRGLEVFEEENSGFFFGRETFSERLLSAVLRNSVVAVVGASGSGKSSVVRAGLLPGLRRQRPPSPVWDAVVFTPGGRPWHRLASVLLPFLEPEKSEVDLLVEAAKLGDALACGSLPLENALRRALEKSRGTNRLLVVVDQFEELFTLSSEPSRRPFVESLLTAASELPVNLAVALRADFYDRAISLSRALSDHLERSQINLGPMGRDELSRAIRIPADRVGLTFEQGLVDRILDDVGEEPGNLPLLEFALTELWTRRAGRSLTNEAYSTIGTIRGAIAGRAEAEFSRLTSESQQVAQRVFTSLVRVASVEDGGRDVRRRVRLEDFNEAGQQIVDRLAGTGSRLLVIGRDESGESVVEVAHEALIERWRRLREWLDNDREFLLWRDRLHGNLAVHERNGALLSGAYLTEASRWLEERREELNPQEVEFIAASTAARDGAMAAEAQRRRRLVIAGILLSGLIAFLGITLGLFGLRARQRAEEARAGSILVAQEAIADPSIVALLDLEIDRLSAPSLKKSLDTVRMVRRAALSALPTRIFHEPDIIWEIAFSPDGSRIATASNDGNVRIWNANSPGPPRVFRGHVGQVWSVAFSPDGSKLLTAGYDGTARVWDLASSGKPLFVLHFEEHKDILPTAIYSRTGAYIIVYSGGTAKVWNSDGSGAPRVFSSHGDNRVSVSPDGSHILTTEDDFTARIWQVERPGQSITLRIPRRGYEDFPTRAGDFSMKSWLESEESPRLGAGFAFSPDGTRVANIATDGMIRIWHTDGSGDPVFLNGGKDFDRIALSSDGTHLLGVSRSCKISILNAISQGDPIVLPHPECLTAEAEFSPDGSQVISLNFDDGSVRLWNENGTLELTLLTGQEGWTWKNRAVFSPDGSRIVMTSQDGTVRIWNVRKPAEPRVLRYNTERLLSVGFSPDSSLVATASVDHTARVWKIDGSANPTVLRGHTDAVLSAQFSSDGSRVVTSSADGTTRIWNSNGSAVAALPPQSSLRDAKFGPDGLHILTVAYNGTMQIWKSDGSGRAVVLRHEKGIRGADFDPTGARVVAVSTDNKALVWNTDGFGKPVVLRGHEDEVWAASFSPDGARIVTASGDRTVRIWKADGTGKPIVLRGHSGAVLCASFSHDGSRIVTGSSDLTARVWSVNSPGESLVLGGHDSEGYIEKATFNRDGSRVLTLSSQGVARLWNADGSGVSILLDGKESIPNERVSSTTFNPDGSLVATATNDGTVRIWRVTWEALIEHLKTSIHACLTEDQRMKYLWETRSDARLAYEACQRELN